MLAGSIRRSRTDATRGTAEAAGRWGATGGTNGERSTLLDSRDPGEEKQPAKVSFSASASVRLHRLTHRVPQPIARSRNGNDSDAVWFQSVED